MSDATKALEEQGRNYVERFKKWSSKHLSGIAKFGKDTKKFISSNAYIIIGATGTGVAAINNGAKMAAEKIEKGATAVKDKTVEVAGKVKDGAIAAKEQIVQTAQQAKEVAKKIASNSVTALNNAEAHIVNGAYTAYNRLIADAALIYADFVAYNMYAHNAIIKLENAATTIREKAANTAEKVRFGILKTVSKVVAGVKVAIAEQIENVKENIISVVQKGLISVGVDIKPEMMALPNGVIRNTAKEISAQAQAERDAGQVGFYCYLENKYQQLLADGYKMNSPEMKKALGQIYVAQMQGKQMTADQIAELNARVDAVHAKSISAKKEGQAKQVQLAFENNARNNKISERAQDARDSRYLYSIEDISNKAAQKYDDVYDNNCVKEEKFKVIKKYQPYFQHQEQSGTVVKEAERIIPN